MEYVFRLADNVVCRQTNSELRMLFDRRKGVMYELNETASAIVGQLADGPATATQIVSALVEEFDGPVEEITPDVNRLLADFAEAGLLVQGADDHVARQS